MADSADVALIKVTPALAQKYNDDLVRDQQRSLRETSARLAAPPRSHSLALGPGTKIVVTLWSYAARPEVTVPSPLSLGSFTLDADGAVNMPYVSNISLSGLSLTQAQETLTRRYTALGLFQKPAVVIDITATPQGAVLVTGAVGQPHAILWRPEGLTLAQALSEALGDGAALLGQEDNSSHAVTATVQVYRTTAPPAQLPISAALEQNIALQPGDRVIVKKAPAVEVTLLGPGVQTSGVFGFGHVPTLAEALARGAGLNANTANDRAVFVLREVAGSQPQLFDFSWDRAQGVIASHRFPVFQGDLVYIAEAPIVPIQRVVNLLFQVAVPAQLAK